MLIFTLFVLALCVLFVVLVVVVVVAVATVVDDYKHEGQKRKFSLYPFSKP